jgi:hypothetical protein
VAPAGASVEELESLKDEADKLRGDNEVAQGEIKYLKDMLKASKEEAQKSELENMATAKSMPAQIDALLESLRVKDLTLVDSKEKLVTLVEEVADAKRALESSTESAKDAEKLRAEVARLKGSLLEKDTAIKTLNKAAKASATAQQVLQKKLDQADISIANGMAAVKTGTEVTKRVKREKSELFQKIDFETKAHKTTHQKLQVLERNSTAVDQFKEDAMRAKADAAAVQAELELAMSRVAELEAQAIKATSAAAGCGGSGIQQSVIGFVCGSVAAIAVQMVAANSEE